MNIEKIEKAERLDQCIETIRQRFGKNSIRNGILFKISGCRVKSLRLLCRPGCFVKEVSMISTSSNKIDEIVAPDEIETYVSMPSCLLQGCSNDLIISVQMEGTISPTTVFMRECFLSSMSARTSRTDAFPAI